MRLYNVVYHYKKRKLYIRHTKNLNQQRTIMKTFNNKINDKKVILSTLWIFVTVNYIFCDVVTLMNPQDLKNILSGTVGTIQMNESFLLGAAIMMEIPFLMILLSRVLNYKLNRWTNIIAAFIMTAIQISSFFVGTESTLHYRFFSIIEIGGTIFIVWYAWTWNNLKEERNNERTIELTAPSGYSAQRAFHIPIIQILYLHSDPVHQKIR